MKPTIHILHLEDDPLDAELVHATLAKAGLDCRITHAQTRDAFEMALSDSAADIILADYRLPMYDGMAALQRTLDRCTDVPFIFVSGNMGEETAIEALTRGATDYVFKHNLSRLVPAIRRALKEVQHRRERKQAQQQIALMSFALNGIHEAAFLIDKNARLHYVNDASCRILEYRRDELLALPVSHIDPDFPQQRWPDHWKALKAQGSLTYESRHLSKSGMIIPVEINANYFEYDGQGYNLALVRDIRERKQMEHDRLVTLDFFRSMDRINRSIQGAGDIEGMMSDVLDSVLSILDCDRAYLMYPCDPDATTWTSPMERTKPDYPGLLSLGRVLPMSPEVAATTRLLLDSDRPLTFGPGTDHPLPPAVSDQFGFKCFMAMAIYPKVGKPWQFGIHQCSHARIWTPEEERLFQEIGRRLTDALTSWLTFRDLQKSERRYRRIVDTANEGIWMIGEDDRTTFVNARMAFMLGYAEQEMLGRPVTDFMRAEDATDQCQRLTHRCQAEAGNNEYRLLRKDGQPLWALVFATPLLDDDHRPRGTFAMVTDVTAKKRAEDNLHRLNQELERRVAERTQELKASHADLEKAYGELQKVHSRMLQQEKMASIGQLAAGVAHEINNPLAFILSNLGTFGEYAEELARFHRALKTSLGKLAVESPGSPALAEINRLREDMDIDFIMQDIDQIVAESQDGGDRMKQIVQNLRNFARLDEQDYKLADLNQGLESTLNIVWNELKYKATVTQSYGEIPQTICNLGQLNQVFMNLLVNAAQAIEQHGEIRISTRQVGDAIVIEIADTGCGIPPDTLNRIFEPFFTTKAVGKGTGLGLSIVYDIVEKHGGEIAVESQPGQGTRFTIRLPVRTE